MSEDRLTDTELDTLLAQARTAQPVPDAALLARIAADASREQAFMAARSAPQTVSLWRQVLGSLGGWQGLGGVVAACAAGLWIGIAPPAALGDPVGVIFGASDTVNLLDSSGFDTVAILGEG